MKLLFSALSFLLVFGIISCKKHKQDYPISGNYKGTFKRYNDPHSGEAQVSISFNYPNWTGSSDSPKYPALNKGTFSYKDDALVFKNTSVWTADFDWTLILDGVYIDRREGDSLIFTKSYGNGWVDVYKLKKQ